MGEVIDKKSAKESKKLEITGSTYVIISIISPFKDFQRFNANERKFEEGVAPRRVSRPFVACVLSKQKLSRRFYKECRKMKLRHKNYEIANRY